MAPLKLYAIVSKSVANSVGKEVDLDSQNCELITSDLKSITETVMHGLYNDCVPVEIEVQYNRIGFIMNYFIKGSEGGEVSVTVLGKVETQYSTPF